MSLRTSSLSKITLLLLCTLNPPAQAANTTNYTYTNLGQIHTIDGPRTDVADVTSYTYDTQGNPSTIINALGQVTSLTNFDSQGHAQSVTDPNGVVTTLTYTPQGWLASSSTAGAAFQYAYNVVGDLTRVTAPDGSFLAYTYDDARRLISVTNTLGETQNYTLDAMGNRTFAQVKDASGELARQQQRTYDELGRLLTQVGASGQTTRYGYDLNNQLTLQTDARSHSISRAYDALGRVTQVVDPLGGIIALTYNTDNKIIKVVDPRGVTTQYTYNSYGQVLQVLSPDSGTVIYTYDNGGNVTQKTDARGVITTYQYDALNRLIARHYPSTPKLDVLYTYDQTATDNKGIGRLTSIQDASGTVSYKYDGRGLLVTQERVLSLIEGNVISPQNYSYDGAGRLTSQNYPDGITLTYSYNSAGQVDSVNAAFLGNTFTISNGITYAPFGPVTQLTWGNGLSLSRTYDQDLQLTAQSIGTWQNQYSFDATGNITSQQNSLWGTVQYQYDALDRLTREQTTNIQNDYILDIGNNRIQRTTTDISTSSVINSQQATIATDSNRLVAINDFALSYDGAGNLQQHNNGLRYTYDASGRMDAVYQAGTHKTASFAYNAQGQRSTQFNYDPVTNALLNSTVYIYGLDGELIGQTIYDSVGQRTLGRYWVWLNGIPLAQIELTYLQGTQSVGRVIYLHPDHLNTPRLASMDQGLVWSWASDSYGDALPDEDVDGDGIATHIPLRFPGQFYDIQTQLNYNYFRDYDAKLGRYVQSDQIGLKGGLNTYGYALGNPLKYSDPKGLNPLALCLIPGVGWSACTAATEAVVSACAVVGSAVAGALMGGFLAEEISDSGATNPIEPDENNLEKIRGNKAADAAAQEAGYDNAHDAKKGRGESKVNIYNDKTTGQKWIWNGINGSGKEQL